MSPAVDKGLYISAVRQLRKEDHGEGTQSGFMFLGIQGEKQTSFVVMFYFLNMVLWHFNNHLSYMIWP